MAVASSMTPRQQLARAVRERFLAEMGKAMAEIAGTVQDRLSALMDEPSTARESQVRREIWTEYKKCRPVWLDATLKVWKDCLDPVLQKKVTNPEHAGLELVGAEVVENKILASRMVMAVMDKVNASFDDLRVRMLRLEGGEELPSMDVLRPDVLVLMMVEQWSVCGMPGDAWSSVSMVVQSQLIEKLKLAFGHANELLIQKGVLPTIELKDRVRAPVVRPSGDAHGGAAPPPTAPVAPKTPVATESSGQPAGPLPMPSVAVRSPGSDSASGAPFWRQASGSTGAMPQQSQGGASYETRMMTAATPLARARSRAQGVIGQLRRLFVSQGGGDFVGTSPQPPSPALVAALAHQGELVQVPSGTAYEDNSPAGVVRVAGELRDKTTELKAKAETKGEKATIEMVALMFQAILAEERIPPGIRVWFARLQMPVLRVALSDQDFLGTTTHPARMLIDRMGSCVMGFDASGVHGKGMEVEIKRIVQVIEQYPETGKKVYQVVFEEFEKFLAKFLTESGTAQKVVSVANQVEQKETLAIQYTIEMRNLLKDVPVRDEIRNFLFKVWAEAVAVVTVRKGPQHADTLLLKKASTDLVWAASAKPNRADRAQVIQELPNLLLRLRAGMTALAMSPADQEVHIKSVSDILADAFMSKTQAIPQEKIHAMAERLANLEDFVTEDGLGDLPLDAESIEMMLGIDASDIEVVTNGGSSPTAAMQAWAEELQVGSWFTLDYNKQIYQLQFAWRSDRKHLNLFAAVSGKSFLIQAGRLAAYLQAGLLVPQEEESLTVRATRDALTKLEANPGRLLA